MIGVLKRVFYATRRSTRKEATDLLAAEIRAAFDQLNSIAVTWALILAEDDYDEHFPRLGWAAWERDVAEGVVFNDRTPRFHVFVVTDIDVGKTTASILRQALSAGKPVLFFDPSTKQFQRVGRVREVDPDCWVSGWSLDLE